MRRALKILADREVSPQTGLLKSTLLQLDSTFSERNYGASSFLDFVEKLAKAGLVQLEALGPQRDGGAERGLRRVARRARRCGRAAPRRGAGGRGRRATLATRCRRRDRRKSARPSRPAEGVRQVGRILAAATAARWPMYLRNVKQILRAADGGFDERRYGFGGLMDLLRACQKESLVRLERDRRGGLRVFPGAALRGNAPQPSPFDAQPAAPMAAARAEEPFVPYEAVDVEDADESAVPAAMPIDTTAELLGTRPRKPRAARSARVNGGAAAPRAAKKTAARKATTRRSTRGKKSPAAEATDGTDQS